MRLHTIGNIFLILFTFGTLFMLRNQLNNGVTLLKRDTSVHEIQNEKDTPAVSIENNTVQTPGPLLVSPSSKRTLLKKPLVQSVSLETFSHEILIQTNQVRKEAGVPLLTENKTLNTMAQSKAHDMAIKQYFAHVSPTGESIQTIAHTNNYSYIIIGENLARGESTESSTDIMNAWMQSPGHKANILNKKYTSIGIGTVKTTVAGEEVLLVVQHFATPRSLCPKIQVSLKESINKKNSEAENIRAKITTLVKNTHEAGDTESQNIYNELVVKYTATISEAKQLVSKYNAQVQNFNTCIKNF